LIQGDEEELAQATLTLGQARAVGRYEVRTVLVPLGRLVLARGAAALAAELQRVRAAAERHGPRWRAAVEEELSLACAEHVQGTDERFLGLANFDWDYVLQARERLEARRAAALALGHELVSPLWKLVAEADRRVAKHRPGGGGSGAS
jgi:hypothetical protein